MNSYVILCFIGFATIVQLVHAQNGLGRRDSVRCWTCSTDTYGDICGDPFNLTKFQGYNINYQNVNSGYQNQQQNQQQYPRNDVPRLETCTGGFGQQAMCKKTVMTLPNNRRIISRECSPMSTRQEVGKCPTEASGRGIYIEFCEYCNEDGCNSASGLTTNVLLAAIIPCALLYLFRK